jgi:hypothetical protein
LFALVLPSLLLAHTAKALRAESETQPGSGCVFLTPDLAYFFLKFFSTFNFLRLFNSQKVRLGVRVRGGFGVREQFIFNFNYSHYIAGSLLDSRLL